MASKRVPAVRTSVVPRAVELLGEHLSKADLLELVWDLALATESPNEAAALEALLALLDQQRQQRRRRPLRVAALSRIRGALEVVR